LNRLAAKCIGVNDVRRAKKAALGTEAIVPELSSLVLVVATGKLKKYNLPDFD
jgi:hypothetical protein